jgi:uncharacterized protein (DUF362 family)
VDDQVNINRRRFLEQVTAFSAGLAVTAPVFRVAAAKPAEAIATEAASSILAVGEGKDYGALMRRVMEPLGGMTAFVKKDDRVVVKPNIGWDRTPEQAANTHPDVIKALVELALEAGAKRVQVFDRTCNSERLCYQNSGIRDAVASIDDPRAVCEFVDKRRWVPVTIENGKAITEWELYRDAIEADCYINVPVAKHHSLARLTLGLKNIMGIMGGRRGKIHKELAQSLADLNMVVAPRLTVIDATRILLAHGPQGGNLDDVKTLDTIIASADIVAADAYATTLFDLKPQDLPSTVAAYESGLGEMNLEKIKVVKV